MKQVLSLLLAGVIAFCAACGLSAGAADSGNGDIRVFGDADGSGAVNVRDVTEIQRCLSGIVAFSDEQASLADCSQNGVTDINDATVLQKYLAEYDIDEKRIGAEIHLSDLLPGYCLRETVRVKNEVLEQAESGDVIFGLFADLHFTDAQNKAAYTQRQNAVRSMRRLADTAPLDFVIQGGDLLTYGKHDEDTQILEMVQQTFVGSRAPLYTVKGDHDSAQSDVSISKTEFAALTDPYMPDIVRCPGDCNSYYFDVASKKTRVICIDTGTVMAGQSSLGADFTTWTARVMYSWLLDKVFTDEVKNGWRFIVFSHAPLDLDWGLGMANRHKQRYASDPTISQLYAKGTLSGIHDLAGAVNNASVFSTKKLTKKYLLTYDENNVTQFAVPTAQDLAEPNVLGITGLYDNYTVNGGIVSKPFVKTKSFKGWTSKVKLIAAGHCHCDRLNNTTLVPMSDGTYQRREVSYGIAYTGAAALEGYKAPESGYYLPCFGTDGAVASWQHIRNRTYGDISEHLMDIWIVGSNRIRRVRFGAGANNPLLSTEVQW